MIEEYKSSLREGNARLAELRHAEARDAYLRSLRYGPPTATLFASLGACALECGQIDEAIAYTRASLAMDSVEPRTHVQLGILCLLLGIGEPGWSELGFRRKLVPLPMAAPPPIPEWDGQALGGRGILLLHEQGLGDMIQAIRYVPRVQARGGDVFLHVQPELTRLFKSQFPPEIVLEMGQSARIQTFAYLMDLPRLFWDSPHGLEAAPYLKAPEGPTLPRNSTRKRVGISWAGSPIHQRDRQRSIPLEMWTPILNAGDCEFVSLLPSNRTADIERAGLADRVQDVSSRMKDLYDLAGILASMDLVITVDTAVAHLAGALGLPVWMLVTNPPDWRWGVSGERTAWYPSMRLFRQEQPKDWKAVIARVAGELAK